MKMIYLRGARLFSVMLSPWRDCELILINVFRECFDGSSRSQDRS